MASKIAVLCVLLVVCVYSVTAAPRVGRGYYTIVAPGTLRSKSMYQVSISVSDFRQPCSFDIIIETDGSSGRGSQMRHTVDVEPGTTQLVKIPVPKLRYNHGRLRVIGTRGIIFHAVGEISIEDRHYSVYLQTDKAKYKPGEVLQFRVICVDRLTRPASVDDNLAVLIYDGQGNLIKEISNAPLVQGVFKGDLQISERPVLGKWKIEVRADGRTMEERSVEVSNYVLSIFSVEITTKEDVSLDEGQIVLTIKSKYTYGNPVKGSLTLRLDTIYSAIANSKPKLTKESQIDGETTMQLDLRTDLNIGTNSSLRHSHTAYSFSVEAVVQDALSGQMSSSRANVVVHNHRYLFKISAPETFDPKELVDITVSVTDLEHNPIRDAKNPVKLNVEGSIFEIEENPTTPSLQVFDVLLDENGVGAVSLNLSGGWMRYRVNAEYLGWISLSQSLEKNEENTFNLDILTKTPQVGKEVVIELKSKDPIDHFVYEIVSRGYIVQSKRISVPNNETTYPIRLIATYAMVPKITIFVHRVKGRTFDSRLKEVYIKRAFQNSIQIDTLNEVKPGSAVSVNVSTDEGSYVGLMGVDKKLLLGSTYKDSLTEENIYTDLRNFDSLNMNLITFPGSEAGLLTFSNAFNRAGYKIGEEFTFHILGGEEEAYPLPQAFDKPSIQLPRIRQLFSDSWMFKDFERTPKEGLKLRETIPDTITSWALTGFSLNPETGLTLTQTATTLKVFQPFFISMDLPTLIKDGEILELPVYLDNYLDEDLLTNVTIGSSSEDLELVDARVQQTISIPAQGNLRLVYRVRPHKPGRYNLTLTAISPKASDAIQKTLTVVPEGVPHSYSMSYVVHFVQESMQEDEISLDIPQDAVPASESVELSVVGDVFGPLMRSLEKLVRVPYGNGEENIKYFVSNVLVLKYLKTLNESNPSLESKAKLHLELGYQNQLTFKHLDGSFSVFDQKLGITGEVGLTAYVMWGFQQAKQFIAIDQQVIDRGLGYLRSKQEENGKFSTGPSAEDDVKVTALTLLSFMVDGKNESQDSSLISTGLSYLYEGLDDVEASASASLSTYALVMGKHQKSTELLTKLDSQTSFTSKQVAWTKTDNLRSSLEMTAAAFINLLESQNKPTESLLPLVKDLVSTGQDERIPTDMIALEAMIGFARNMDLGTKDLNIHFSDKQKVSGDFHVDTNNAQVLQTVTLPETCRSIHLQTKGIGFAIVNVKYTYNLLSENQSSSSYQANATVKVSTDMFMVLEVCVALRSPSSQSNLTTIEIYLQSGYRLDGSAFNEFQKTTGTDEAIQFSISEGSVQAYVRNISDSGTCIQLPALKTHNILDAKPGSVIVYDGHNEDKKFVSFFRNDAAKVDSKEK